MTQPPDDPRPTPPEPADAAPPADQPTVAWTPPTGEVSVPASGQAPAPPSGDAPVAPPPNVPPAAQPQDPLISASPSPTVAWAPPAPHVREIAPGLVFAGTAPRLVAFIIDSLLVGLVSGIIASSLGLRGSGPTTLPGGGIDYSALFNTVPTTILTAALGGVYFVLSWSGGRRATIGQRLFHIQVGNAFDGASLTLEQAVRRWLGLGQFLGFFVFAPGLAALASTIQLVWWITLLVTTATSPTKQGLHDRFSNTALVRPTASGNGLAMGCLVLGLLVLAAAVIGLLAFLASPGMEDILSRVGASI